MRGGKLRGESERAHILVVDDKAVNVDVIRTLLSDQPYELHGALSGTQALEMIPQLKPDLVLLDIAMPGMDGIEVCRQLRADSAYEKLPIIFVTAMANRLEEAFAAGGSDFVTKPLQREELLCRMRVHLQILEQFRALKQVGDQLQYEREIARHVMNSVTCKNVFPGDLIQIHQTPQNEFCGDLVMTAIHRNQGIYLLVADFTGHGLAAAIGTIPLSLSFHAIMRKGVALPLGDIAAELNRVLLETSPDGMYCAAMLAQLEPDGRTIHIWQGGMPDSYLVRADGTLQEIHSEHMALAAEETSEFERRYSTFAVEHGDRLLCLSDGLAETFNDADEMFGEDRIKGMLKDPAVDPVRKIPEAVINWRGELPQDDDLTLVQLTCGPVEK